MLSIYQFGPCLLSTHFKAVVGQHVIVVVAYVPTDVFDASVKDAFHAFLLGYLKVVHHVNKVVVLGDFNVELGRNWESSFSAVGWHHLHHGEAPSDNGECLLDLVAFFGLHMVNTFFPQRHGHLVPSSHPALVCQGLHYVLP